jgi:beta-lactamase regulating signal transducer with metallopeptidase domain
MLALLLEGTLKGSVILALAGLLTGSMRRQSAAARHLVWTVALLATAALPLATRLTPAWNVTIPAAVVSRVTLAQAVVSPFAATDRAPAPATVQSSTRSTAARIGTPSGADAPSGQNARPLSPASPTRTAPFPLASVLVLGWVLGAAVLLLRLLTDVRRLAHIARRAAPVTEVSWRRLLVDCARAARVTRPVRLLTSEETDVPLTWGLVRPVVVVGADHEEWSAERRRLVLSHEFAHVARWDSATQLAAQILCALYWFNPLVWLAARALRNERERACDDRVLTAGTRASTYAGELLEIARHSLGGAHSGVALAMARRSELEGRLLAILNPRVRRGVPRPRAALAFGAAALVVTLPLAAFRLAANPGPSGPESTPTARVDPELTASITKPVGAPASPASKPAQKPADEPGQGAISSPSESLPAPNAPAPTSAMNLSPCDQRSLKSDHSHSSTNWSDSGNKSWRVSWSGDGCSVDLVARGDVKFNADFTDVSEISSGGYLEITVREGESTRRLEFRPQGGTLRRTYTVNGNAAPYDDAARAWLAAFLIDLDRHTAFAVEARFPALVKQGVPAVLDEIDKMASDYGRGVYYRKLFTAAKLSPAEVRRVAQTAGASIDSDYELGRVLSALAEQYSLEDATVRAAFIEAAGTLESDYERAQLLLVVIAKGAVTPEASRTIVKLAGAMTSDYEKARVLMALGQSRLIDPKTAGPDYLDVVVGMKSDYERGRVLKLIVDSGQLSKESLVRVLDVVGHMSSDYEAANVLVEVASHNQLGADLKDAYLKAADRLKSDYESQRARAALRQQ